jgi:hypothetical protein
MTYARLNRLILAMLSLALSLAVFVPTLVYADATCHSSHLSSLIKGQRGAAALAPACWAALER